MGSVFSKQVSGGSEPAAASVGSLAQTIAQQNRASEQSLAGAIKGIGETIWGAYKGKQESDLQEALQTQVDTFQSDLQALSSADTANKALLERERSSAETARTEYFNSSILAGVDQKTAASRAMQISTNQESSVLSQYRATQQKLMAARDAMPQRQHEMMQRSEAILKEYIAKMPSMANNFRQIAEEVTGKRGLDLYSVQKLYQDVDYIEKQTQAKAKADAEREARTQQMFIDDMVGSGKYSKTAAAELYNGLSSKERISYSMLGVEVKAADEAAKKALKDQGNALANYTTARISQFNSKAMQVQTEVMTQLVKLNVSPAQIAMGNVPEATRNNPEYNKIIETSSAAVLNMLNAQYSDANTELQGIISGNATTVDKDIARTAMNDLNTWYQERLKYYTENKTAFLSAYASSPDSTKLMKERLEITKGIAATFNVPSEIADQLFSMDPKTAEMAAKRYPQRANEIRYINSLMTGLTKGVGQEDWNKLVASYNNFQTNGVTSIPKDKNESSAAVIDLSKRKSNLESKVKNNEPIDSTSLMDYVSSGMATPANVDQLLVSSASTVFDTALSKLPPEQKEAFIKGVQGISSNYLYGMNNYGDMAKNAAKTVTTDPKYIRNDLRGLVNPPNLTFNDTTGNSALAMTATMSAKAGLDPVSQRMYESRKALTVQKPAELNKYLTQVDNILRVEAKATGIPITKLRQEFIMTFNQAGMPSDIYSSQFVKAAGEDYLKNALPNAAAKATEALNKAIEAGKPADAGYGLREDGTPKGSGWFGELKVPGTNEIATEYSIGVNINGKETLIPTLVPTLDNAEIDTVLKALKDRKMPPKEIIDKAVKYAEKRIQQGKSPFATSEDKVKPRNNKPFNSNDISEGNTWATSGDDILDFLKSYEGR